MTSTQPVKPAFYVGLFLVTMTTMLYQMLLTRIFSVTMWYHFAFVAVSLAMFGITAGAIIVFLFGQWFENGIQIQMSRCALLFAVSIVFCLLTQLSIPFRVAGIVGLYSLSFTYFVSAIPFVFSGIIVCLALTKFPEKLTRIYSIDLLGAGIGCIMLIPLLRVLDGPTAVVLVASGTALGALFFALDSERKGLKGLSVLWALFCFLFVVGHTKRVRQQKPLLNIMYSKGMPDPPRLYEKWNAFSCVRVFPQKKDCGAQDTFMKMFGAHYQPDQLFMNIDAAGGTPITAFDGNLSKVEFVKNSQVNLAHYLRPNSNFFVIGPGGGIDVLGGLVFNQKKIVAVEINNVILDTVNKRFGDFTGHLDHDPRVTFVNDEARSYITRAPEKFDIVLANVIDTWAAGAAGAFALTENSLYTVEAWVEYLKHLNPNGIITFTRWYYHPFPDEMYRLTGIAVEALKRIGVQDTAGHIVIVTPKKILPDDEWTQGTLLLCKEPFSKADLDKIESLSKTLPFDIRLSPRYSVDQNFVAIASGKNLDEFYRKFEWEISPSVDDKPFFFQRFKIKNIFSLIYKGMPGSAAGDNNVRAMVVLGVLLITVLLLVFFTVLFPLFLKTRAFDVASNANMLTFFASIGIGFMMVEISQLQRLSIFLGHPTYSLSVVLFSLLIGSGLGSFFSKHFIEHHHGFWNFFPFVLLLAIIFIFGFSTPVLIEKFITQPTMMRILIALLIIFPLGFVMGMPFSIGMSQALRNSSAPAAWFWGINGSASVCATVLAVAASITWGISVSFWIGAAFYIVAAVSIARQMKAVKAV